MRTCKECGIEALDEVSLDVFVAEKGSKHGRRNLCKRCQYARNVKYTDENTTKVKEWKTDYQVNRRYGMTERRMRLLWLPLPAARYVRLRRT